MVAVPIPFASTLPLPSTLATLLFDEAQINPLFVAFVGDTVAFNCVLSPKYNDN